MLLLPDGCVHALSSDDLRRFSARARYCPRVMIRGGAAGGGAGDDMIASRARRCTLAEVASFGRQAVLCVEWTEPGEVRPRYHLATEDDDGLIGLPPWAYDKRRLAPPGVRSCGIKTAGGVVTDCTRDIKSMTVGGSSTPPVALATYLLSSLRQTAAIGPLSDCEFWCRGRV